VVRPASLGSSGDRALVSARPSVAGLGELVELCDRHIQGAGVVADSSSCYSQLRRWISALRVCRSFAARGLMSAAVMAACADR